MADSLVGYLKTRNIKFAEYFDLAKTSSIKVGARARLIAEPTSIQEFVELIDLAERQRSPYKVIGRLTNTLFAVDYNGLIISTNSIADMRGGDGCFTFACGASLAASLAYAAKLSYGGVEQLGLIPGSIGGAVFGNAGAHGVEMADIFESARIYLPKHKQIVEVSVADMGFSYRYSRLKSQKGYILDVTIRLQPTSKEEILSNIKRFKAKRAISQPSEPSLGSIFKRVDGISAGYYIDRAGLKGATQGGAAISSKHAGFIVNLGGATADDILSLIKLAKERVYENFGITLEEEIQIF